MTTAERKAEHIRICLEKAVETDHADNGLSAYRFDHDALPDLDFDEVDTGTTLLGKPLQWPFLIGSMTGGTKGAADRNEGFARAAARVGCGMALGSLRPALEEPSRASTFDVRARVDRLPLLLGNLGIAQLGTPGLMDRLVPLCEALQLDGLIIHLNPLQEVLQPEGDTAFRGLLDRLVECRKALKDSLGLPLAVKEVGSGLSPATADRLKAVDPDLIETAGVGGTSWIRVEGLRAGNPISERCSHTLADWGHSMTESIVHARAAIPRAAIVASGGLRTGLDLARAIRLGASAGAMALPLLRAAENGPEKLDEALETVLFELRTVLFGTGSRTLEELRRAPMRDGQGEPVPVFDVVGSQRSR